MEQTVASNITGDGTQSFGRRELRSRGTNEDDIEACMEVPAPILPTTSVTPSEQQSSNSAHSSGRRRVKDGYHPEHPDLRVQDCMCSHQGECRKVMWRWANINGTDMFPYVTVPKHQVKTTSLGKHLQGYRENVIHHFYGHLPEASQIKKDTLQSSKVLRFAVWHLPPAFRPYVQNKEKNRITWWRIPRDVGSAHNLTRRDECPEKVKDEDEKTYFVSPIRHDIKEARKEVEVAEREYQERKPSATKTPVDTNSSSSSARCTPMERRVKQLSRSMESDPEQMSKKYYELETELEAKKLEIARMEKDFVKRESDLRKSNEKEKSDMVRNLQEHGLTRMTLCNDKYHESRPSLAPHLYGSTWNEHKQIGNALFGGDEVEYMLDRDGGFLRKEIPDLVQKDWSIDVSGEGPITPFEQYSICCMIARRNFPQETVAGMYDVKQNSISRYMTKWAPLLGAAGRDNSELDLEMDHNIFPIEYCKKEGLPYIDPETGEGHTLEEYNHMSDAELLKIMDKAQI